MSALKDHAQENKLAAEAEKLFSPSNSREDCVLELEISLDRIQEYEAKISGKLRCSWVLKKQAATGGMKQVTLDYLTKYKSAEVCAISGSENAVFLKPLSEDKVSLPLKTRGYKPQQIFDQFNGKVDINHTLFNLESGLLQIEYGFTGNVNYHPQDKFRFPFDRQCILLKLLTNDSFNVNNVAINFVSSNPHVEDTIKEKKPKFYENDFKPLSIINLSSYANEDWQLMPSPSKLSASPVNNTIWLIPLQRRTGSIFWKAIFPIFLSSCTTLFSLAEGLQRSERLFICLFSSIFIVLTKHNISRYIHSKRLSLHDVYTMSMQTFPILVGLFIACLDRSRKRTSILFACFFTLWSLVHACILVFFRWRNTLSINWEQVVSNSEISVKNNSDDQKNKIKFFSVQIVPSRIRNNTNSFAARINSKYMPKVSLDVPSRSKSKLEIAVERKRENDASPTRRAEHASALEEFAKKVPSSAATSGKSQPFISNQKQSNAFLAHVRANQ